MTRTVLFAEVPCFYAAVERADDPDLVGRPIIVGGDPRKRGLVQGASPEALAAGVNLDQPILEALKLCPEARAIRTNMGRYREALANADRRIDTRERDRRRCDLDRWRAVQRSLCCGPRGRSQHEGGYEAEPAQTH